MVSAAPDVWLNKDAVVDLLCITESTFYRRLAECNWVRKKNGRGMVLFEEFRLFELTWLL